MRWLLVVVSLFILGCASPDKHYFTRVTGSGVDENSALQVAFVKAIEQETGTLILSERESQNLKLLQSDILAYSSGYVDDFRIIESTRYGNHVTVIVDVKVSESKIKSRILTNSTKSKDFNSRVHGTQYKSYLEQRQQSDQLLAQVFKQFPDKAFNVTYGSYSIELDTERNAVVKIPFKFSWNHNFLIAVEEMLNNIEDVPNFYSDHKGYVIVITKRPGEIFGTQKRYRFNDLTSIRQLNVILESNEPMIKVSAQTIHKNIVHESCVNPKMFLNSRNGEKFYTIRSNDTTLVGNVDIMGTIVVTIPPNMSYLLSNISSIQLNAVSRNKC